MNNLIKAVSLQTKLDILLNQSGFTIDIKQSGAITILRVFKSSQTFKDVAIDDNSHLFEYSSITNTHKYIASGYFMDDKESINEAQKFIKKWLK